MTDSPDWKGPAFGACMNAASVCRAFETSRRREVLSFKHHAAVATPQTASPNERAGNREPEWVAIPSPYARTDNGIPQTTANHYGRLAEVPAAPGAGTGGSRPRSCWRHTWSAARRRASAKSAESTARASLSAMRSSTPGRALRLLLMDASVQAYGASLQGERTMPRMLLVTPSESLTRALQPCWWCRYWGGAYAGAHSLCNRPGNPKVQATPATGCAFYEREAGADDEPGWSPLRPAKCRR
jgi:hypothetical protein